MSQLWDPRILRASRFVAAIHAAEPDDTGLQTGEVFGQATIPLQPLCDAVRDAVQAVMASQAAAQHAVGVAPPPPPGPPPAHAFGAGGGPAVPTAAAGAVHSAPSATGGPARMAGSTGDPDPADDLEKRCQDAAFSHPGMPFSVPVTYQGQLVGRLEVRSVLFCTLLVYVHTCICTFACVYVFSFVFVDMHAKCT